MTRRPIARVVASYDGQPCTQPRPLDASERPGEPCGEIHEFCRGHVRSDRPNRGDPCQAAALPGINTCEHHGGHLPESAAIVQRARAVRLVGRLTGSSGPVDDPLGALADLAGEREARRRALWELVAELVDQAGGDSAEAIVETQHTKGGSRLVLHPLFVAAMAADNDVARMLADMTKLGFEEKRQALEAGQLEVATRALQVVFMRLGLDPATAFGLFAAALREQDALPGSGTVVGAVEAVGAEVVTGEVWP